jgi:hypothetical protein
MIAIEPFSSWSYMVHYFDTNGLEWEHFSPDAHDQKIVEIHAEPIVKA